MEKARSNPRNVRQPVVLVDTSPRLLATSCNGNGARSVSDCREKPDKQRALQPGVKGWLDHVILPILLKEILNDNSGEFNSRGLHYAVRYLRALLFQPAIA
jgi:hypothetical protein